MLFKCEKCRRDYKTFDEAYNCENLVLPPPVVKVGDIITHCGHNYGWYDGDVKWITNPEVREGRYPGRQRPCPNGTGNCFDTCCLFQLMYVVTDIREAEHEWRFTIVTKAIQSQEVLKDDKHRDVINKLDYSAHYQTFCGRYGTRAPDIVPNPPAEVVEASKALIGIVSHHYY